MSMEPTTASGAAQPVTPNLPTALNKADLTPPGNVRSRGGTQENYNKHDRLPNLPQAAHT
jgi:hypothetical protein